MVCGEVYVYILRVLPVVLSGFMVVLRRHCELVVCGGDLDRGLWC